MFQAPWIVSPSELAHLMTMCTFVQVYKGMINDYRAEQCCVDWGKMVLYPFSLSAVSWGWTRWPQTSSSSNIWGFKKRSSGENESHHALVLWSGSMAHPCLPSINPLTSSSLSQPPGWHAPIISSVPLVRRQGAFRQLRETDCVQTLAIQCATLLQWKCPGPGRTIWIKYK